MIGCGGHVLRSKVLPEGLVCDLKAINELYELLNDAKAYPCQPFDIEPIEVLVKRILKVIVWLGADWERMPTGRLQLYPHQLTIEANVWLFFIKKKILPTRHDSTCQLSIRCSSIAFSRNRQLGFCNARGTPRRDGAPQRRQALSTTIAKLCLKYLLTLTRLPRTNVVGGRCNLAGLNRVINLHQNEEEHHVKDTEKSKGVRRK